MDLFVFSLFINNGLNQSSKKKLCSSCNMGTSDLPEIYTRARERSLSASVHISGKSQVPMLQLIYSTWVNHLQVYMETAGMLCECIYMGPCDFRLWVTS